MPKNPGAPNASIFIKNLPYEVREDDLKDVFTKFGRLRDVYIPLDYYTKVNSKEYNLINITIFMVEVGSLVNSLCD